MSLQGEKNWCYFSYLKIHCFYTFQIRHGRSHSLTGKETNSFSRCESFFSLLGRNSALTILLLCFHHLHWGMLIEEKRVIESFFRVFYEHANQSIAGTKIPDFVEHYLTCSHLKPGYTLVQHQMKGKHCKQKRTVLSDWNCL